MDSILPGGEFNAGFLQGIPAFPVSLSLEGFSQMVCNIGSIMRSPEQRTARTGRTCSSDIYSDMLKQLSAYSKEPGESEALSLEGVSQMVYILPERLLALVRPAFDLVLRRIRSLKRCVQA